MREHWDRTGFYLAFAGYGVFSMFRQGPGMAAASTWVSYPTYALFVVAAALLAVGFFADRRGPYVVGHVIAVIAVLTVTGVILTVTTSPGSMLTIALALTLLISLRRSGRDQRALRALRRTLRGETGWEAPPT